MSVPRFDKVIVIVVFAICCPQLAKAADLTLAWDPPNDGITTGYILSYGESVVLSDTEHESRSLLRS